MYEILSGYSLIGTREIDAGAEPDFDDVNVLLDEDDDGLLPYA